VRFTPRPYQQTAVEYMFANKSFALFLDPGMGKSACTLETLYYLRVARHLRAALVIAPIRPARFTWPAEVEKWTQFNSIKVSLVLGSAEQRLRALRATADVYVINPENVEWLVDLLANGFDEWRCNVLVVDESTKFKNPASKRFKALKKILPRFERRYILTGTPAAQSLQDLWAQIGILDFGVRLEKNITSFRNKYFDAKLERGGYMTYKIKPGADEKIFTKIADISMRLDARDHLDMPELITNRIEVDLPPEPRVAYDKMERDFIVRLSSGTVTAANAAVTSIKLRQLANGAVYDDNGLALGLHQEKLAALSDLIEEQQGQPLLVAVAFQHDAVRIRSFMKRPDVHYLGGGMTSGYADRVIRDWNAGRLPVLLAHPASVAHGLNLQAGGHSLAWFSLTWSLEDYLQMVARVWRQGQASSTVIVHHIIARDTVDEAVVAALTEKNARQSRLFETLKAYADRRTHDGPPKKPQD
jgi:SNF2 family DNA or RNA helicase